MLNRTVKILMFSDIFVTTGFGLVEPILAIFINENISGGTVFSVGLASTLYLGTKSILQLPFSRYVDTHKDGEDIIWLVLGTFCVAMVPFIYIFATSIYFVYLAQVIYGIGSGLAYPTWLRLWTLHLDKRNVGFAWSLYSTLVGLGTAISASIGAGLALFIGFKMTFVLVGVMSLVGCGMLFILRLEHAKKFNRHTIKIFRRLSFRRHHHL